MDMDLRNVASSSRAIRKKKMKGWTTMFPVPSNLVESYQGVMSSKLTFRSGEYGKKWRVKVKKFKNQYFFTDGWKEFEEEVDLKSREFLMFRTASSIRRGLLGKNKAKRRKVSGTAHGTKNSSLNDNENNGSGVEKKLSFLKKLKDYHRKQLDIPINFARQTGILQRDEIKLKDSEGREWPVHVIRRNNENSVSLCGGWLNFLNDNNIVVGSTLSFLSSSSDTIDVQIVKEGTNKEALFKLSSYFEKRSSFHKKLMKGHQYYMFIPSNFVMTNGSKLERGLIKLKISEGRAWPVHVIIKKSNERFLSRGWFDFLKGNNVVIGSTLSFSSSSTDTIDVQIVEEGIDKQALFKYVNNVRVERGDGDLNNASDHTNVSTSSDSESSDSEEEMDLMSEG